MEEFRFLGMTYFYPMNSRYSASYVEGRAEIWVGTPYTASMEKFRLVDLPYQRWTPLKDSFDRPIPLEIYVDHTGVSGHWLP